MVIAAFLIATLVCIAFLGVIYGGRDFFQEQSRKRMVRGMERAGIEGVKADDFEAATGTYGDIHIDVKRKHWTIDFEATLPPAIIGYDELVDRFASDELQESLAGMGLRLGKGDTIVGSFAQEAADEESFVAVGARAAMCSRVRDLRQYVPAELLERIPKLHGARELDELLRDLETHFPDAGDEVREAYRLALKRDQSPRLVERAKRWLGDVQVSAAH